MAAPRVIVPNFLHSVNLNRFDLKHLGNELVDLFSTGTGFSAFHEVEQLGLAGESSLGVGKLERPQEVVGLLEVRSDGVDLLDEVSSALDSGFFSKSLGNNSVGGDRDALLVDLSESTLVDKLLDGGTGGVSVCHVRFDQSEHSDGSFVQLDEGTVVKLTKTEELHDLLGLGGNSDDTANTDDQTQFGFSRDEESAVDLGLAAVGDGKLFGGLVLFVVLLGASFELDDIGGSLGFGGLSSSSLGSGQLLLSGLLLKDGFRALHGHGGNTGKERRKRNYENIDNRLIGRRLRLKALVVG